MSERPELSILSAGALPPWGVMNVDARGDHSIAVPCDWLPSPGATLQQRTDHFDAWFQETLETVNRVLWPAFDPRRQVWIGESVEFMEALTRADLDLMLDIQHPPSGISHFRSLFQAPLRTLSLKFHRSLYHAEDGTGIFDNFPLYCRNAGDDVKAAMSTLCIAGDFDKQAPVNFRFKNALQRPRPMQMAQRFQKDEFEHEDAATSISPSMCSGHCLQGVLEVAAAVERLLDDKVTLSPEQLLSIAQWGVDIGDRRVMAGVHYPGDNLCSWFIFLRMADFVFHQPDAFRLMAYGIRYLSFIYQEIHRWAKAGGLVYEAALTALDHELDKVLDGFDPMALPAKARTPTGEPVPVVIQKPAILVPATGKLSDLDEIVIARGGVGTTLGVRRLLDLKQK